MISYVGRNNLYNHYSNSIFLKLDLYKVVLYIVYRVLSIYWFLSGFREIAVFEKIIRFFILFFDGRYREEAGPWQGPKYMYIVVYKVLSIYRFLPGFREIAVFEKGKRFFKFFLDGRYRKGVRALARAQIYSLYTCLRSLSSSPALITIGPRTAYCISLTHGFMLERFSMVPAFLR